MSFGLRAGLYGGFLPELHDRFKFGFLDEVFEVGSAAGELCGRYAPEGRVPGSAEGVGGVGFAEGLGGVGFAEGFGGVRFGKGLGSVGLAEGPGGVRFAEGLGWVWSAEVL